MNKTKLKALTNSPVIWDALSEYLDELEAIHLKNLKQAEKPELLYRTQGYLQAIDKIRGLRANVNVE